MKIQNLLYTLVAILISANVMALNSPTNLTAASVSESRINLSWKDKSNYETGFIIQRSLNPTTGFSEIARIGANNISYANLALNSETKYYYRIRGFRKKSGSIIYSSYSNIVSAKTTALAAISHLPSPTPAPVPSPTPTPAPNPGPSPVADRIYGVTISNPWNQMPAIMKSLSTLAFKPTARVVFDEFVPASDYKPIVDELQSASYVMGEILDSYYMPKYSVQAYKDRTTEYLNSLGSSVNIWEIGNEINGEWLGDTTSVKAKMTAAYDIVKAANKTTALTLYYNKGCFSKADHEMFTWTQNNVPEYMKLGLDYVFISFYEDDCNGIQPNWNEVFNQLGEMFPNSKIGFGENGTVASSKKESYINRYYRMSINHPRFIHGNFWWYFDASQNGGPGDMVPQGNSLWTILNNAMMGK